MIRTIEATIDKDGRVHLSEPVQLPKARRAIVTILEDLQVIQVESYGEVTVEDLKGSIVASKWEYLFQLTLLSPG